MSFALGEELVRAQLISKEQLKVAEDTRQKTGERLSRLLVSLGYVAEDKLLHFLSEQLSIPFIELKQFQINFEVSRQLPEAYARRLHVLLVAEDQKGFLIGMAEPLEQSTVDELHNLLQQPISLAFVRTVELTSMLDLVYRRTADISNFAEQLDAEVVKTDVGLGHVDAADAPVIRLLQSVFEDAVQINASDIHIEPDEKILRIRLRVDGVLHEQIMDKRAIAPSIMLRLKLMSGLNISEKRLPQDGRFNIKVRNKMIDVRLSTLPTQYGESAVMRLLLQERTVDGLGASGMPDALLDRFRKLLTSPHGILLVTGPTGSGKTTTLYSALQELNIPTKKIITVEDPVEYRMSRINQVQINAKLGLDFAQVLRTVLRQDPNIIMLGEMRDQETATVAIRAALTGHLVLSTLHTNDSASSAFRLVDMGVEGYLVAAVLRGVLAQRLVRKNCSSCMQDYTPTETEMAWLISKLGEEEAKKLKLKKGKGCNFCNGTGYKGRKGIYELLELNTGMIDALRKSNAAEFSQCAGEAMKGKLLVDAALELAKQGVTMLSEVFRIAGEV
jgi:MSHA biogenesis protein MshE